MPALSTLTALIGKGLNFANHAELIGRMTNAMFARSEPPAPTNKDSTALKAARGFHGIVGHADERAYLAQLATIKDEKIRESVVAFSRTFFSWNTAEEWAVTWFWGNGWRSFVGKLEKQEVVDFIFAQIDHVWRATDGTDKDKLEAVFDHLRALAGVPVPPKDMKARATKARAEIFAWAPTAIPKATAGLNAGAAQLNSLADYIRRL